MGVMVMMVYWNEPCEGRMVDVMVVMVCWS